MELEVVGAKVDDHREDVEKERSTSISFFGAGAARSSTASTVASILKKEKPPAQHEELHVHDEEHVVHAEVHAEHHPHFHTTYDYIIRVYYHHYQSIIMLMLSSSPSSLLEY